MKYRSTKQEVEDFLSLRRIALVGASRDPKDFSRALCRELLKHGYDVVPINPNAEGEIEGRAAYARVGDVPEPVDGAILMTPADQSLGVVQECARAGIDFIWLHKGGGPGAVSPEAVAFCHDHDMSVIAGQCPFMFLPHAAAFHRVHAFFKRIARTYPAAA